MKSTTNTGQRPLPIPHSRQAQILTHPLDSSFALTGAFVSDLGRRIRSISTLCIFHPSRVTAFSLPPDRLTFVRASVALGTGLWYCLNLLAAAEASCSSEPRCLSRSGVSLPR